MFAINVTEQSIYQAIGDFISGAIHAEIIQGLDNQVAMPKGGFVSMLLVDHQRLATNTERPDPQRDAVVISQLISRTMQCDFYGEQASDWATIITTLYTTQATCELLAKCNIQPLYTSNPKELPIINGEKQAEHRWMCELVMNYRIDLIVGQQFANEARTQLIHIDTEYPPTE